MKKMIKEAVLWLVSFSVAALFCYGIAAVVSVVCGWL